MISKMGWMAHGRGQRALHVHLTAPAARCKALCGAHIRWQDMGSGDHDINHMVPTAVTNI
jgi:hypothetical protein